ncbi:Mitochondrial import inner membrane translocase subunit tim22 [Microbotryomycetes sp. JL221]|nr:Mitochondrial import inner membrane translocase subunit tim22 [Microbotryomycetes sp. JL221]
MNFVAPFVVPGYEPNTIPGSAEKTPEERAEILQNIKQTRFVQAGIESPAAKAVMSGGIGFALGAFFSLMGSSFTLEDPFQQQKYNGMKTMQKAKLVFKDMGVSMWRQGKGFGMVGALYAGTECIVEGYRAKNDIRNSLYAGAISGAVLARNSGLRAMVLGGLGFAAFSGAIDTYIRWDSPDEDA